MKKIIIIFILCFNVTVYAHPPQIIKAQAQLKSNQLFDVAVTIRHADTGWDHYVKEWVIIADGERQLAKRIFYHPHVNEQPSTRYSRDVFIPKDAKRVTIHAKCNQGHESRPYILLARKTSDEPEEQEASK